MRINLSALILVLLVATSARAAEDHGVVITPVPYSAGVVMSQAVQAGITPEKAIGILKAGNERFLSNQQIKRNLKELVQKTSEGQYPFASVVACMDSRSGPEIVFDQSIGDLFVIRIAGNVANDDIIGSLEYASKVRGSKLIVVLGHTNCGAIKGACDEFTMGNLTGLLRRMQPAVIAAKTTGARNSSNYAFVDEVGEINVADTIRTIREKSPILQDLEAQGKVRMVGAFYDLSTGQIHWQLDLDSVNFSTK